MRKFKFSRTLGAAFLSLVFVSLIFKFIFPPPLVVSGSHHGAKMAPIELPWSFQGRSFGNQVNLRLNVNFFTPRIWRIIPDDNLRAISVNNQPLDLSAIGAGLSDYGRGFEYDFSPYIHNGQVADIRFVFDNAGGPGGINLKPQLSMAFWLLVMLGFLPLVLVLARDFRLLPEQKWLLCLALIAIAFYWADTPWTERAYDVQGGSGHYDYIGYIATKHALPAPNEGWTYYHPPLYYLGGAVFWQWAEWLGLPKPELIRVYGLMLWFVFLIASAGALRKVLANQYRAINAGSMALFFWPGGVMHAVTIGNDLGLYACAGVAVWFMVLWRMTDRLSYLFYLALACALAMLCKSNGLPLIAAAGLLVALRALPNSGVNFAKAFKETLLFSAVVALGIASSFAVRLFYFFKGVAPDWLIANAGGLHSGLRVPADIKAFLPLDIPTFLTSPWMSAWEDSVGRGNFWNYTLRSSISGEFHFDGRFQAVMAYVMGLCVLLLFLMSMLYLAGKIKASLSDKPWKVFYNPYLPLFLLGFFWVASLIALRYKLPYACSNDFRYIVPVILPFVICCARFAAGRLWLWGLGCSSALFFATLGIN